MAEGVSEEAAARIADMKKPDMAQAAEQLLVGTGWLPTALRTAQSETETVEVAAGATFDAGQPSDVEAAAGAEVEDEASYAVAAE